ncbi:competence type IV pilus assembly protein ComGB [Kurthia sibirica]|uniref:Competence protein ComG n=1 Tax=Kurthia sibirica TaxID=202750 RepID=A0A2U3ALW7_9BACL|nr:competence type IV pilus assembly protein ComGB [Kurthia sibirica]PWI25536.1 competence protein ComG [Kurthia sibirica]GEK33912.1 hypothetical protein KSI01_14450 [Kurthia sibirica]
MKYSPMRLLRDRKKRLPSKVQGDFIKMLAILIEEGYAVNEVIDMLAPHHLAHIENVEEVIHRKFKEGQSLSDILLYLGLPKYTIMSIYVAEQHCRLTEALTIAAQQLQQRQQQKAQMYKLLTYPIVLIIFMILLFIGFRVFFLPTMTSMLAESRSDADLELMLTKLLLHLPDYFVILGAIFFIVGGILFQFIRRKNAGEQLIIYFKIPIIKRAVQLQLTRQFSFELGALLLSGLSIQVSLNILIQQKHQKMLAYIAQQIMDEVVAGESLSCATLNNGYFLHEFQRYIQHGEQSGNLGQELQLLSRFLGERMGHSIEKVLALLQPLLFSLIAICIIAAYLAIMLPMYNMLDLL